MNSIFDKAFIIYETLPIELRNETNQRIKTKEIGM